MASGGSGGRFGRIADQGERQESRGDGEGDWETGEKWTRDRKVWVKVGFGKGKNMLHVQVASGWCLLGLVVFFLGFRVIYRCF